jgi:hypothetical protein
MKKAEYTLSLTDVDKLRIEFIQHRGKILKFVVQYHALIETRWRVVIRMDNCHGLPHQHVYHLHKKQYKLPLGVDNNTAFTQAKTSVMRDFKKLKENFLFST